MPYTTITNVPQALRTAGLNLSQANYWAQVYDGAKASGSKFAGAIAWTQFKKKYKKVGNKWVLRSVQKDLASLDQLIEDLERVFQDFEVKVVKAGEEPSDLYEEGDELSKTLVDELSKTLVERLQILYRLENGQLAAVLDSEDVPLGKNEELEELEELKERYVPILKVNKKKHIVYGVVLEPEVWDAQQDIASIDEIEKAAHDFLAFYRKIDLRHHYLTEKCYPVESYLAPQDMKLGGEKVKKGSWILGTKVADKKIWKDIEDGALTGFSIVGYAQRVLEE